MLKRYVGLLALGATAVGAYADTIHCEGKFKDKDGVVQKVELYKPADNRTIALAIYPADSENPGNLTFHYDITEINPMFPVYTVSAMTDLRPVDRSLVELRLSIRTEGISVDPSRPGMPATLRRKDTPARGGRPVSREYRLTCQIER